MSKEVNNSIKDIRRDIEDALGELAEERGEGYRKVVKFDGDTAFGLPPKDGRVYMIEGDGMVKNGRVFTDIIVSMSEDGSAFQEIGRGVDIDVAFERAAVTIENESTMALGR